LREFFYLPQITHPKHVTIYGVLSRDERNIHDGSTEEKERICFRCAATVARSQNRHARACTRRQRRRRREKNARAHRCWKNCIVSMPPTPLRDTLRRVLHDCVFEADTRATARRSCRQWPLYKYYLYGPKKIVL